MTVETERAERWHQRTEELEDQVAELIADLQSALRAIDRLRRDVDHHDERIKFLESDLERMR